MSSLAVPPDPAAGSDRARGLRPVVEYLAAAHGVEVDADGLDGAVRRLGGGADLYATFRLLAAEAGLTTARVRRPLAEVLDDALYWPDLDEGLSIRSLILGRRSGESATSLQRWLDYRARGEKVPVRTLPLPPDVAERMKKLGIPTE